MFEFLRLLPVVLLRVVATYACIGPVKGRLVAKFGTRGSAPGQFNDMRDIACSEATGELFVVDSGNGRIQVFSLPDLTFLRAWGTLGSGPGQFKHPHGIALFENIGQTTRVFVADVSNNRVQEFQADGTFIRVIDEQDLPLHAKLFRPHGLAVNSTDQILYVSELNNNRISAFSLKDGKPSSSLQPYIFIYQRCVPRGMHFDEKRKLLFITEHFRDQLEVVGSDGSLVRKLGVSILFEPLDVIVTAGEALVVGKCVRNTSFEPSDVIVGASRETLTASQRQCFPNIQVIDMSTGKPCSRIIFGEASPTGICRDPCSGLLFVASGMGNIYIFE